MLIAETTNQLQVILTELNNWSSSWGLWKLNVLQSCIIVKSDETEEVKEYFYLG